MPNYLYKCDDSYPHKGCGYEWEETLSVAERIVPMKEKCPDCGKKDNIIRLFTSVNIYHGVVNPHKKMDENFKSEMKRIKKDHPDMESSYF